MKRDDRQRREVAGRDGLDTEPLRARTPVRDDAELAAALGNQSFAGAVARSAGHVRSATTAGRGLGGALLPRAVLARDPVSMEETTIVAGGGDFFEKVRGTMRDVSTRTAANAGNYGVEVLNACESFKTYANAKIEDLDGEITGEALAGILVGAALAAIGGQLTAKIGNAALKFVAAQVADAITGKVKDGATRAASTDDDEKALKAAIDGITQGARDAGTYARRRAQEALDTRLGPIFDKCSAREALSPAEDELVAPFWDVAPARMDGEIESMSGIPSTASAAVAQVEIYRGLVEAFEQKYIGLTASLRESIELANFEMIPGADRSRSLPGRARTAAAGAAGQRAGALGLTWQDFARAGRDHRAAVDAGLRPPSREEYDHVRDEAEFG